MLYAITVALSIPMCTTVEEWSQNVKKCLIIFYRGQCHIQVKCTVHLHTYAALQDIMSEISISTNYATTYVLRRVRKNKTHVPGGYNPLPHTHTHTHILHPVLTLIIEETQQYYYIICCGDKKDDTHLIVTFILYIPIET